LLVFAVLVLLYGRIVSPVRQYGIAAAGAAGRQPSACCMSRGLPVSMPVFIGMLMLLGIVAKNSILVIDFALEEMENGATKDRSDSGGRPQARAADHHDHGGDGRGHVADRLCAVG
jgi:multidrug efflux pump subunit AcrB